MKKKTNLKVNIKIKIAILTLLILSIPSIAKAEVYIQNDYGSVTWRTCKLFYVYDDYKKEEIIPTIRYIETISNFTFRKWKKSMKKQPHIEIYYLGASDTGVAGRAFIMDDYSKARINNVYISMFTKNEAVLLHEMLHAIGLAHNEDPNSIMNAYSNESQILTEQDLINIRNIPCGSKKKK
jgi:hypothetical protein